MALLLKDLLLIGIALVTGLLGFFGIAPGSAVAPDLPPAAKIEVSVPEVTEATSTPAIVDEETSLESESKPQTTQSDTQTPPATKDPFQSVAEAFAQLAQDSPPPATSTATLNELVRGSVVNIVCTTETSGPFNSISASGVLIDPRGVILTNAHVGQYFLLKDYPKKNFVECIVRTGSPATPAYTAELLFLPPSWIAKNAQKIDDESPTGNGEHDYALVRVTGMTNPNLSLPSALPYLSISTQAPEEGDDALVAGYPAGFLGGITIAKELYAASANTRVGQLYTFATQTVDLFSVGGSIVAQQGSSGGAVARDGALMGLIVTSSQAEATSDRDLRAISTEYIIRDFENESGVSLVSYLTGNLSNHAQIFNTVVAPTLTKALTEILDQ